MRSDSDSSTHTAIEYQPGSSRRTRHAEISADTNTDDDLGVHQEIAAGLGLAFPVRINRGRLNVSEASVPAPTSSDILVAGELFIPSHDHPRDSISEEAHPSHIEERIQDTAEDPIESAYSILHFTPEAFDAKETEATRGVDRSGAANSSSESRSEVELNSVTHKTPNVFGEISESIPQIRIQKPSVCTMDSSLGTSAINGTASPAGPGQPALESVPASALTGNTIAAPLPSTVPTDLTASAGAVPVNAIASGLPVPLPIPGLPIGGKGSTRKKLIHRARKHVLRKRILGLLVGRELAQTLHPLLSGAGNQAGSLPVPVDGASDVVRAYTRRHEQKCVTRTQVLDNKLAHAKLNAHAEELQRCSACRGLTQMKHLRRYHRLQLKKDRPDMSTMDRYVTALARVATSKCKCPRRTMNAGRRDVLHESIASDHP